MFSQHPLVSSLKGSNEGPATGWEKLTTGRPASPERTLCSAAGLEDTQRLPKEGEGA